MTHDVGAGAARQRALLLRPVLGSSPRDGALALAEASGLVAALDLHLVRAGLAPLRRVAPGTYFGSGRVEELRQEVAQDGIDAVVVDGALSPVQQRNLERAINAKVIDRTGLILEIFARRARTREGRVQVELARQQYERSRLVRTWTHLERQRGGLGKMGGPGETQIETDRRLIQKRIDRLKLELEEVRRTRALARRARARAGLPSVVLLGYTNAGKSSLFNRLTQAGVVAKDMPFATLDPTARLVKLPSGQGAILADTVGFITDLPTELVAAFRATLEAVAEADLLVHVRDIAHPETDAQKENVEAVLAQVLAQAGRNQAPPVIEAWNKIDLLDDDRRAGRIHRAAQEAAIIPISALTGDGMEALLRTIEAALHGASQIVSLTLDPGDGKSRAMVAAQGRIVDERFDSTGRLHIRAELRLEGIRRLKALLSEEAVAAAAE